MNIFKVRVTCRKPEAKKRKREWYTTSLVEMNTESNVFLNACWTILRYRMVFSNIPTAAAVEKARFSEALSTSAVVKRDSMNSWWHGASWLTNTEQFKRGLGRGRMCNSTHSWWQDTRYNKHWFDSYPCPGVDDSLAEDTSGWKTGRQRVEWVKSLFLDWMHPYRRQHFANCPPLLFPQLVSTRSNSVQLVSTSGRTSDANTNISSSAANINHQ